MHLRPGLISLLLPQPSEAPRRLVRPGLRGRLSQAGGIIHDGAQAQSARRRPPPPPRPPRTVVTTPTKRNFVATLPPPPPKPVKKG
jgi:hypothetical protein